MRKREGNLQKERHDKRLTKASPSLPPVTFSATVETPIEFFIWIRHTSSNDSNLAVFIVPDECPVGCGWEEYTIFSMDFVISMFVSIVVKVVVVHVIYPFLLDFRSF